MFDELKLNVKTNFMKGILSRIISKTISKKFGYKVNIQINDIDLWMVDGDTTVKLNVEAKVNNEEFKKIMKDIEQGV